MRRSYKRDGWEIVVNVCREAALGLYVELTSPRGRTAEYLGVSTDEGEAILDDCPYPEFVSGALRDSEHIRELASWAIAQWYAAEKALEPDLAV